MHIEAVKENLRQRGVRSLLGVFVSSLRINVPESFLGYQRSEAGNNAGEVQDLIIKELAGRGRDRIKAMFKK